MKEANVRSNHKNVEVSHYSQRDWLKVVTGVEDDTEVKLANSGQKMWKDRLHSKEMSQKESAHHVTYPDSDDDSENPGHRFGEILR